MTSLQSRQKTRKGFVKMKRKKRGKISFFVRFPQEGLETIVEPLSIF